MEMDLHHGDSAAGMADDDEWVAGGQALILCCMCGVSIPHNPANMCANCVKNKVDISAGITKEAIIFFCRGCGRYQRPPYVHCNWESSELLALCLKKIRGLNKVKLVDASFIYTEEHSRRIKVKLTVQKEVFHGAIMEKSFPVLFKMQNQQCTTCQKSYTDHTWEAQVQVRQKVNHKRTFFFLEQLLLKHSMTKACMGIKEQPEGLDFHFGKAQDAQALIKFLEQVMPVNSKASKRLISQDDHNNVYRYKHTMLTEIAPVSKNDLVLLPPKLVSSVGGISPLCLCYRVSNQLHFIDPCTRNLVDVPSAMYWRYPFKPLLSADRLTEFVVMQVEEVDNKFEKQQAARRRTRDSDRFKLVQVSLCRASDFDHQFECLTHLGNVLREGDSVLGYDIESENCNNDDWKALKGRQVPEVVLVRKVFPQAQKKARKRVWELKRMQKTEADRPLKNSEIRAQERDYEAFLQELEEDPEDRQRINLYRSAKADAAASASAAEEKDAHDSDEEVDDTFDQVKVRVEELMSHMSMHDEPQQPQLGSGGSDGDQDAAIDEEEEDVDME